MTLTEKIEDTYKQMQIILEKIDKNTITIIEITEKIFNYINKEEKFNEINNIKQIVKNISIGKNEEDKITEIRKIQEVLDKLEKLLKEEEDCKAITRRELEKIMENPKEIIKSPTILRKPFSTWRG